MGTGYTRNDTTNNIADGNVINAADLDGEFDAIVTALGTGGHTHDGTAAEGGPVTVLGPAQDFVVTASIVSPKTDNTLDLGTSTLEFKDIYIDGTAYIDGLGEDILVAGTSKIQFTNTSNYIHSASAGNIDLVAATEIHLTATTINMDGAADISGNLGVGGNLTVTGTTTFNGGTITLGDAAADNIVFGADVDSSIIPDDDDTYDLGSSGQQWRDIYIDGSAYIDGLAEDILVATDKKIQFRDTDIHISSTADGDLSIAADDEIDLTSTLIDINGNVEISGTTAQVGVLTTTAGITSGSNIVSDTDSTDDLGTTSVRWANLYVDAITATDQITATGFTGTLDGILGSGTAAAATTTTLAATTGTFSGILKTDDTTEATSTTDGSLQTDGGLSVAKDIVAGDDIKLLSDSAVIHFGADSDITLTHAADTSLTTNGVMIATTFEPSADTAAGDNAAIGYTSAEGLILTGQGSTNDVTIKNDADADVIEIPTGTTNVTVAGTLGTGGAITSGAGLVIANAGTIGSASVTDAIIIDSAGRIQVNGTAVVDVGRISVSFNSADSTGVSVKCLNANGGTIMRYHNSSNASIGGITSDGSTTAFATSSDYRLKENVDYTWDATTRLKQLKPARFNFIADESNTLVDGFIAHEVSSIVPEAIIGEKDATEMQGIDQSKLVPLLVKTIQELEARIKTLEDA